MNEQTGLRGEYLRIGGGPEGELTDEELEDVAGGAEGCSGRNAYKRVRWPSEHELLAEVPRHKLEFMYGQSRPDRSKKIAYDAIFDDLDPEAVDFA